MSKRETCGKKCHSKNIVSSSKPQELLHGDLFGPVKTAPVNDKKYESVTIIIQQMDMGNIPKK